MVLSNQYGRERLIMSFLTPQALRYIEENQQSLVDLIAHLCTIPAPSNHE